VTCKKCRSRDASALTTLIPGVWKVFCSKCGATYEVDHRIRKAAETMTKVDDGGVWARFQKASAGLKAALREAQGDTPLMETDMENLNFEVRKRFAEGRVIPETLLDEEWRAEAENIYQRSPGITAQKAFDQAGQAPVDRFSPPGPTNPTRYELKRTQSAAPESPVLKQASDAEAEAWRGIERLADELRRANPQLTPQAAVAKSLVTEKGQRFYAAYSKAQRIRAQASK